MVESGDKVREDFFSEAQEIVEGLSRNLLALDDLHRQGRADPSLVNEAFRAVHTLKGLSSLFGAATMGNAAHHLEDILDDLRLGRIALDDAVVDILFRAVEVFNELLASEKSGTPVPAEVVEGLLAHIRRIGAPPGPSASAPIEYDLDVGMLAVLTEYEEHRLRANIEEGRRLYRLRVRFDLVTIDKALEDIKERAKKFGEIITYLPTGDAGSADTIELDLLMASTSDTVTLTRELGAENVQVEEVPRLDHSPLVEKEVDATPIPAPRIVPADKPGSLVPAVTAPGREKENVSLRSVSQTVRVDIRRLDHLMNIVGELAIVRGALSRVAERVRREGQRSLAMDLQRLHRSFERRLGEMQAGILEVRMVPLGQVFERLARVVRQISREVKKEIRLVITGSETEIDKLIVEELSDPLMHMIRNAIDHGIESAEKRVQVGKPTTGTIALNAFQKGNHVMLEVEDDGRGIDEKAILDKAIQLHKISADEARELTRSEVLGLIFLPGVSTRESVDDLSGRGVGMDVVKNNIGKLGGVIDVHSDAGIGTKIAITLPITLAIVSALLMRASEHTFALPLSSVSEAIPFDGSAVRNIDGRSVMSLRGTTLPICRLDEMFGLQRTGNPPRRQFAVVASLGTRRLGLVVDQLVGEQDIVIKPLGPSLSEVRGFAGATELGDQRVGLVLDAAAIIEEVLAGTESALRGARLSHG
ncbi:MAG TPA: chemotaxis protein CheA [Polyangiaceae bacterium]|nr:chemotaxis protein CheA [Polyangiaceae bacterium]